MLLLIVAAAAGEKGKTLA